MSSGRGEAGANTGRGGGRAGRGHGAGPGGQPQQTYSQRVAEQKAFLDNFTKEEMSSEGMYEKWLQLCKWYAEDTDFRMMMYRKETKAATDENIGEEVMWESLRKVCETRLTGDVSLQEMIEAFSERASLVAQAYTELCNAAPIVLPGETFRARLAELTAETPERAHRARLVTFGDPEARRQNLAAARGRLQRNMAGRGVLRCPGQAAGRQEAPRRGGRGAGPPSSGSAAAQERTLSQGLSDMNLSSSEQAPARRQESPRRGAGGAGPSSPRAAGRGGSGNASPSNPGGSPTGQGRGSSSRERDQYRGAKDSAAAYKGMFDKEKK